MSYIAYITRDNVEYEVAAELYDEGCGYVDSWADTGRNFEIEKDPEFHKFYAEDDNGVEIVLTADELLSAKEQMVKSYWDKF